MTAHEIRFESRRSPILSTRGVVATSHPLAAQAGLDVLRAGGNAADAAVATAAALAVVEPCSTGLGGDCFALFYAADTRRVHALNASGRAPAGLSLARLAELGIGKTLPSHSVHAVTVPGAAAGWVDTVTRFGKLSLAEVLGPAIALAEEGHPVAPVVARQWALGASRLAKASPHGAELLLEGRAPRVGEVWVNHPLSRVLRELAEGGVDAFYRGRAGQAIIEVVDALGGLLTAGDLSEHESSFEPPLSKRYRDVTVWECRPNGQGLAALLALALLEGFEPEVSPIRSAAWLHLQIECMRLAFADAYAFVCDPAVAAVPSEALLEAGYLDARRLLVDLERARVDPARGAPWATSDTVYLAAVDGDGHACSFINSNYEGFGTGIVPRGCGFSLQNRGAGFSLDPAHPNALAPRKRPFHTIMPGLTTGPDGRLDACFGVMGGFMQPQGHLQVVSHRVDRGLDPQLALDEPRFCLLPSGDVLIEDAFSAEVADELARRGHRVQRVGGPMRTMLFGRGQIIARDPENGVLWGGSDGRADGAAVAA